MKDLETLTREEAREIAESQYSSTASETMQTIQEPESDSRFETANAFGREAYRLSPLSEW
jgi:hypothetical protein